MDLQRALASSMVAFALFVAGIPTVGAQAPYPSRPIRLVIPFAPGGSTDTSARLIAQKLGDALGQPVVVENRAGAGGTVGSDFVAKSAPDGYTVVVGTTGTLGINPSLYRKLPYDPQTAFEPVSLLSRGALTLVVNSALPVTTVRELADYARSRPGQINLGSSGSGTPPHLVGVLFGNAAGFQATHIPFQGGAPALTALLGGQVHFVLDVVLTSLAHAKAGRIRVLAVTTAARSGAMPEVPTMAEAGFPEATAPIWNGILAPGGTPREAVMRLNTAIRSATALPDIRQRFPELGIEPVSNSPEQFGDLIRSEMTRWAELVKRSGATVD